MTTFSWAGVPAAIWIPAWTSSLVSLNSASSRLSGVIRSASFRRTGSTVTRVPRMTGLLSMASSRISMRW
jgi:hypothetical protein